MIKNRGQEMSKQEYKTVKGVFKDYRCIGQELSESKIKSINLFKKTNSLEIILLAQKNIKIRQIESFEKYLESRFLIKKINIKIELEKELEQENTSQDKESVCETVRNGRNCTYN